MSVKKFSTITKKNPKGNIIKLINENDKFSKFKGEAYISKINKNKIKAWKLHKKANLNLFIIYGKIILVTLNKNKFHQINLDYKYHNRIYIPKGTIFGFQNLSANQTYILSISDVVYDKKESLSFKLKEFEYNWLKK